MADLGTGMTMMIMILPCFIIVIGVLQTIAKTLVKIEKHLDEALHPTDNSETLQDVLRDQLKKSGQLEKHDK